MPRGGRRPGAGRKKGSEGPKQKAAKKVAQAVATRAAAVADDGLSPLEIILDVARKAHAGGDTKGALEAAVLAAPYCHPKLQTIEHRGAVVDLGAEDLTDSQLAAIAARAAGQSA